MRVCVCVRACVRDPYFYLSVSFLYVLVGVFVMTQFTGFKHLLIYFHVCHRCLLLHFAESCVQWNINNFVFLFNFVVNITTHCI